MHIQPTTTTPMTYLKRLIAAGKDYKLPHGRKIYSKPVPVIAWT